MSDPTSVSLLERVRGGSDDAWNHFHGVYKSFIEAFLRREGVDAAEAADVCQEVMLVLMRKMPRFEHSGRTGAFRSWLRNVVRLELRDHQKAKRRRGQAAASGLVEELGDPQSPLSQLWDQEHDRHVLRQLIEKVSDEFRPTTIEAFRRVALEKRDAKAVADELGMSKVAVRIAKSKVLAALKREGAGLLDD